MSELEEFQKLEQKLAPKDVNDENNSSEKYDPELVGNEVETPKMTDGFRIIERNELPFNGRLYPESWNFAYRCPTTKEVANFSTIQENEQARIIGATEELVKSCFTIIDKDKRKEISTNEINDGERLFFFLKLREFYLHDKPIEYVVMSGDKQEPVTVKFLASSLIYPEMSDKLLNSFDGRMFSFELPETSPTNVREIKFLIPTLGRSQRIFSYLMRKYKEANKEDSDGKKESEAMDKQFLLFAPYLYETGNEKIADLRSKYKKIIQDEYLTKAYLNIITNLKLTHKESITIDSDSEEETPIKFPGGWKAIFDDKGIFEGFF